MIQKFKLGEFVFIHVKSRDIIVKGMIKSAHMPSDADKGRCSYSVLAPLADYRERNAVYSEDQLFYSKEEIQEYLLDEVNKQAKLRRKQIKDLQLQVLERYN